MSAFHRVPCVAAFLLSASLLAGCANTGTTTSDSAHLDIQATSHSIYEGEIVTVTTRSMNTLGSDAKLEWSASGGKLSTEQNDRIARVKFDEPGHYIISAKLKMDGRVVDNESVEITVRPLTDKHD